MTILTSQLDYWNNPDVESMYDKNLLKLEIEAISKRIPFKTKVLDVGCGEGEGTLEYSKIFGTNIHAVDFSETRLQLAKKRLDGRNNVVLDQVDLLNPNPSCLEHNCYDVIISQRFLINILNWELQKQIIKFLASRLKPEGILIMLEGSVDGVNELNEFRAKFNLESIPVKHHNLFFQDKALADYMDSLNFDLIDKDGFGEYFLLTRGIRPIFQNTNLEWDCPYNLTSSSSQLKDLLKLKGKCSRLKLWVWKKYIDYIPYRGY